MDLELTSQIQTGLLSRVWVYLTHSQWVSTSSFCDNFSSSLAISFIYCDINEAIWRSFRRGFFLWVLSELRRELNWLWCEQHTTGRPVGSWGVPGVCCSPAGQLLHRRSRPTHLSGQRKRDSRLGSQRWVLRPFGRLPPCWFQLQCTLGNDSSAHPLPEDALQQAGAYLLSCWHSAVSSVPDNSAGLLDGKGIIARSRACLACWADLCPPALCLRDLYERPA